MLKERLKRNQEKMGQLFDEYKAFRDGLPEKEDDWTPEQVEKFDRFDADIDAIDQKIDKIKRSIEIEDREKRYSAPEDDGDNGDADDIDPENRGGGADPGEEKREAAFNTLLRNGINGLTSEQRDMLAGTDVEGGFLVTPQQFVKKLLKNVDDMVKVRGLATVHTLKKAASLGAVNLDEDVDDWDWTAEIKTGSEDDGLKFGNREMRPNPIAKRIKVSNTLIRLSDRGVQSLITGRMGYKLGGTMEQAYMTGDGHNKPLGLFVASDDGVPTTRDVSTDNTATVLAADNLIEVQGTLKEAYQGKARWLFHRDAITKLRKLKSSDDQYLWEPGLKSGQSNMILGKPYVLSEWCPNTFTASKYVGMYADFSYYWILDCLTMAIQVLKELYAETNQIGYIGRYEGDGQPVLSEAFVRIQMGS